MRHATEWARFAHWLVITFMLVFFLGAMWLGEASVDTDRPASAPPAERGSVEWLIERHGCWTQEAPPDMVGRVPGHVVVTWPGDDHPTYGGAAAVAAALDHRFSHGHPGLLVHAFCR